MTDNGCHLNIELQHQSYPLLSAFPVYTRSTEWKHLQSAQYSPFNSHPQYITVFTSAHSCQVGSPSLHKQHASLLIKNVFKSFINCLDKPIQSCGLWFFLRGNSRKKALKWWHASTPKLLNGGCIYSLEELLANKGGKFNNQKDLLGVLILIIPDQISNDLLCCSNKYKWCLCTCTRKLYILLLTFLINVSEICIILPETFWIKLKTD